MTVTVLRLKQIEAKRAQIRATPCAGCTHPYHDHEATGRCWSPRIARPGITACRCRQFIDPDDEALW